MVVEKEEDEVEERSREREREAASHAGSEIYFRDQKLSGRTDSGTSTVALEFSGCLARSHYAPSCARFDLSAGRA